MKKSIPSVSLLVCLLAMSNVFAGRVWYYSDVLSPSGQTITSAGSAIGMRSDGTWPVVAYCQNTSTSGVTTMLPGSWAGRTSTFGGPILDGTTAPDGTVAFVDNYGVVATFGRTGWGSGSVNTNLSSTHKNSIAFDNSSSLAVLYRDFSTNNLSISMKAGSSLYSSTVQNSTISGRATDYYALDFDSYNQANIVYQYNSKLAYGVKGVTTSSQWVLIESPTAPSVSGAMDMALTNNDIPVVVYLANPNTLGYSIYNRLTSSWISGLIDSYLGQSFGNFTLTADENGGIGLAYVTNNTLKYAYYDGSGFSLPETLTAARGEYTIGLTFDYENNPVISYMDSATNRLKIAYDPIPEPATMAIFALGLAFIRRK